MRNIVKYILPPLLALALCISILWRWTNGFSAFTVFTYTLSQAGTIPRVFPDLQMIDQDENIFRVKSKHKYVLINFVYLNCPEVCHKVNNRLEDIYCKISPEIIPSRLELVTVSFDAENDNITKIKNYRSHFGPNISGWAFALPYRVDAEAFEHYLLSVGVWAKSAPGSEIINHSTYIYLVSPYNKIIKIFDPAREDNSSIINEIKLCVAN